MNIIDWFKNKSKVPDNVVPFPEQRSAPRLVPEGPHIESPAPKKEPRTFYSFGLTDDNRMTFQMGHSTLTMNREGVENLINQLEFFKNQLEDEEE